MREYTEDKDDMGELQPGMTFWRINKEYSHLKVISLTSHKCNQFQLLITIKKLSFDGEEYGW
jgi:hypothetical protein